MFEVHGQTDLKFEFSGDQTYSYDANIEISKFQADNFGTRFKGHWCLNYIIFAGTFLCNSEMERRAHKLEGRTVSLW